MVGRIVGSTIRWAWHAAAAIPLLALIGAAFLNAGELGTSSSSGGERTVYASVFPLVLAALDPLVWTSMGHSVGMATGVAIGSLVLGVAVGEATTRRSSIGSLVCAGLVLAPAVMTPAWLSLGLLGLFGEEGPAGWPGFAARLFGTGAGDGGWAWIVWTWSALVPGVALVAWATRSVRDRIDPGLEDAARIAGAGPLRAWWTVAWPLIRPVVATAVCFIFSATLADPGPPLILGLRRTMSFQIVSAATSREPFPRAAAVCLLLLGVAVVATSTFRLWGRAARGMSSAHSPRPKARKVALVGRMKAMRHRLLLGLWAVLAWLPVVGLAVPCLLAIRRDGLSRAMAAAPTPALLGRTLGVGIVLAIVLMTIEWGRFHGRAWWQGGERKPRSGPWPGTMPLLVAGVGLLAISRVAGLGVLWTDGTTASPLAGRLLRGVAWLLDPYAVPGLLVVLGCCLDLFARERAISWGTRADDAAAAHRSDQALMAGTTNRGSRRLGTASGPSAGRIALLCTTAATAISPAIILAATPDGRTLGPGIVAQFGQPGGAQEQAAALALLATLANLIALSWAGWASRRSRVSTHEHLVG